MNIQSIEAFLAIVDQGGITAAASRMFTTQSNISKQLQKLEKELGVRLLYRDKGIGTTHLTEEGEQFYPVAKEYYYAHVRLKNFREDGQRDVIRVASVDSLNASVLVDLYPKLIERVDGLNLSITTNQTNIIYDLINRKEFDIGFVLNELRWPNIVVKPFVRQQFKLIMYAPESAGISGKIHLNELDPEKEVFQPFGPKFLAWHDYWWPKHRYKIKVDTVSMMNGSLFRPGCWSIVPESVAAMYRGIDNFYALDLAETVPARDTYYIVNSNPSNSCRNALAAFEEILEEYKKP